jgi:hypothetical protein
MIRSLVVESAEARDGATRTPHPVEGLSDSGSCYTATETVDQAHAQGLLPCPAPVKSPASDGMAEVFVKNFERNCAHLHDCLHAQTVLARIHHWIKGYIEAHPDKRSKVNSRREFIRGRSAAASCPVN